MSKDEGERFDAGFAEAADRGPGVDSDILLARGRNVDYERREEHKETTKASWGAKPD